MRVLQEWGDDRTKTHKKKRKNDKTTSMCGSLERNGRMTELKTGE